jgi:hypothetical protein
MFKLVGVRGLEPPTSATRTLRASQLRYTPTTFKTPPVYSKTPLKTKRIFRANQKPAKTACAQRARGLMCPSHEA